MPVVWSEDCPWSARNLSVLLSMASALAPTAIPNLPLPLDLFPEVGWFHALLSHPGIKSVLPFPLLLALAWPIWRFFRQTWRELDSEATAARLEMQSRGEVDYRPLVVFALVAATLTIHEYYGGRSFYTGVIKPELLAWQESGAKWLRLAKYDGLYAYGWWSLSRILGYVIVPIFVWKSCFPRDKLLDLGLRTEGFFKHLWIYGLMLAVVLPAMLIVAKQPDFGTYYPFYKGSSRSWFDFLTWEAMYYAQFFALEFFFRGWMVGALRRSLGASAIFAMAVPYCMIHYGKPYLEAHGAIVAGVVLGSLSMKTRSIYAGFLVHVTVAAGMDFLSLYKQSALPKVFWPG